MSLFLEGRFTSAYVSLGLCVFGETSLISLSMSLIFSILCLPDSQADSVGGGRSSLERGGRHPTPSTTLTHFPKKKERKCAIPQPAFYSWSSPQENTHTPSSAPIQKTPSYFKPIHLIGHLRYTANPSQSAASHTWVYGGWSGIASIETRSVSPSSFLSSALIFPTGSMWKRAGV